MSIKDRDDAIHAESLSSKPVGSHHEIIGTVRLIHHDEVVLIPTPSPDPRDPLNLPQWRKWAITITLGLFSVTSVLITSGMGAIYSEVAASYNFDPRANDLLIFPTLFMGIGNLIAMPLAMAIGRRPVFLTSALVLTLSCVWCAASQSLGSHIAGRDILSMAAGQSEALCPLIIQEIHFMHERSGKLAWFSAIQSIGTASLIVASNYLTQDLGWKWWYGVFATINGTIFILSFFLVPESLYNRPTDAFEGAVHVHGTGIPDRIVQATTKHGVQLDFTRYKARTFRNDIRIFHVSFNWKAAADVYTQMLQCFFYPNIMWVVFMNSAVLGIYVVMANEFPGVLIGKFGFAFTNVGYVFLGQVVVSFIMVPLLGYGGDLLTHKVAEKRGGISEPEYRLIPMLIPAIVVVISSVVFGMAASHPGQWSPWAIIISFNAEYFGFIGIVLIGYTYSLDCYPERSAAILVLICAVRGLVSFGINFGITAFIETQGHEGALRICAIIMGVTSVLGFAVFFFGKKIRAATMKYAVDNKELIL